jgi:hypothetical protein
MRKNNQQRREVVAKDFEAAAKLAAENGLSLRALAFAGSPGDVTQYRIEGPYNSWFKDIYPGNQRIYCPDKKKQGPFINMCFGKHWGLLDVVRACLKAIAKEPKPVVGPAPAGREDLITGVAGDTRKLLVGLIAEIGQHEGAEPQSALRDLFTDLRHVVDHLKLDFHAAEDGSYEVYLEEKDDLEWSFFDEEEEDGSGSAGVDTGLAQAKEGVPGQGVPETL